MSPKKNIRPEHIEDAIQVTQKLGSEENRVPKDATLSPKKWPNRKKSGKSKTTHLKGTLHKEPKAKIKFLDGLGVDPETGEFVAHFREGKTHTLRTEKFTREEAETWLEQERASLREYGRTGVIKGLTFREGFQIWVKKAPMDLSRKRRPGPDTVEKVERTWRLWVLPIIGDKAIESVDDQSILSCVENFQNSPGPYGPHTERGVRSMIINVNSPINFLKRRGFIRRHPILPVPTGFDLPPIHYVPFDRIDELMERIDRYVSYDLFAMIYFRTMGFAGLRTKNARALRKEYFKLSEGTFDTGPTKGGKSYNLPVPEDLTRLLMRVPNFNTPGPLLPNADGEGRGYGWCLKHFKRACIDLGLTNTCAWHTLRASYATFLIRSNVDLLVVKDLMTHETLEMILRYAGINKRDLKNGQTKGLTFVRESRQDRDEMKTNP